MPEANSMRPATHGVKLTYDDFVHFPDDGQRHELIDGVHYVTPSPNVRHQQIVRRLLFAIHSWLLSHPIGEVFAAPLDVVLTQSDVVEPDLFYVSNARRAEVLTQANIQGTPELVIEIASPSTRARDEVLKRALYEQMGVEEYWFVDPDAETVRVHRAVDKRFQSPTDFSHASSATLTTPLLPGFQLPLDQIFRD